MVVEWLHHRGLSLASVSGEDLQSLLGGAANRRL
jgi:integrase/recombinase XerD